MTNAEKRRRISSSHGAVAARPAGPQLTLKRPSPSLGDRLRYRFDLALSRGPLVVIGYLGLVMLAVILVATVLVWVFGLTGVNGDTKGLSIGESFWQSSLRVLDSGTFASDRGWSTRVISLLVTLAGIFIAGSLIGLIASAVDQKIEDLRKGRSRVIEHGHTLVLGWSPRLPVILSELVIANGNQKHAAFVVLSTMPKAEMEDDLRAKVPDTQTTRVVCRTGDPSRIDDLTIANATGARSIIVLAGDDGDAGAVKSVLAMRSLDPTFERAHVVVELQSADHARTLRTLTEGRLVTIQADEVIARVTAQACHQAGLSSVYRELLDFDGDEIYFADVPELAGHSYSEALLAFDSSTVMGRFTAAAGVELNPPPDTMFEAGDLVIAVSEDDDKIVFGGFKTFEAVVPAQADEYVEPPQRILVVGWSSLGPSVLDELDEFLSEGSEVDLVLDTALIGTSDLGLPAFFNTTLNLRPSSAGPESLLALCAAETYDQAIVLGYREHLSRSEADARTMLTLLTLHKAWPGTGPDRPRVVAEMLDPTNVAVAGTTGVNDFIVSDELSSLMISQVSERLELHHVFDELFDAEGCFIALHPAPIYVPVRAVSFAEIVAAAATKGESALGYRIAATGEVVVNPSKSATAVLGEKDQVLVLGPKHESKRWPAASASATA